MIKKLFATMLAAGLILLTTFAAQTLKKTDENGALSPELKKAAGKILAATVRETRQLNAPENRIRAGIIVAGLLWEQDEREARATFQNALLDLQNLFASINLPENEQMTRNERAEHYAMRDTLAAMRREFVLTLAGRDPQAALNALAGLKIKTLDEYDPLVADELELQLAAAVAQKDPEKSLASFARQFDANGLNYQFTETLKDLHRRDSGVAAKIAKDMLARIKRMKIIISLETDKYARQAVKGETDIWQLSHFINTATELNRTASRDKTKKTQPLYSAAEMKELVELIAGAYFAAGNPQPLAISQVMPEIAQFAPATAQRIKAKIGAENVKQLDRLLESQMYNIARLEKSVDELAADAERAAPDVRDQRLADAAFKAIENGDAQKAQMIAARIKDRKNYYYLFEQIGEALPLSKARSGDATEVRKMLAGIKTKPEKIKILTELASALAAKGEKQAAKKLLDEAMALMPASLKSYSEVESALRIAEVYAVAAPEQAFAILENGIAQSDEYINAGVKLTEFHTAGSSSENELLFGSISRQYLFSVPNGADLIKKLAHADIERTVSLTDKFQRPEIRIFVRLRVLEALLDENAAEKEKTARDLLAGDDET